MANILAKLANETMPPMTPITVNYLLSRYILRCLRKRPSLAYSPAFILRYLTNMAKALKHRDNLGVCVEFVDIEDYDGISSSWKVLYSYFCYQLSFIAKPILLISRLSVGLWIAMGLALTGQSSSALMSIPILYAIYCLLIGPYGGPKPTRQLDPDVFKALRIPWKPSKTVIMILLSGIISLLISCVISVVTYLLSLIPLMKFHDPLSIAFYLWILLIFIASIKPPWEDSDDQKLLTDRAQLLTASAKSLLLLGFTGVLILGFNYRVHGGIYSDWIAIILFLVCFRAAGLFIWNRIATRVIVSLCHVLPLRLSGFLDLCVTLGLCWRFGQIYLFTHRLYFDYFAALTDGEIRALSKELTSELNNNPQA